MENITILVYETGNIPPEMDLSISAIENECFKHVNKKEIETQFYVPIRARICAIYNIHLVGCLKLHYRQILFQNIPIKIGGAVGVCVSTQWRRKGIGETLMRKGLDYLTQQGCDFAILTVDPDEGQAAIGLYQKLGFSKLNRQILFIDSQGHLCTDSDIMVCPLNSREKYTLIMNSREKLHFGKGYW